MALKLIQFRLQILILGSLPLLAGILLLFAYQFRPVSGVQMGDFDKPFLADGFYAVEKADDLNYRWTSGWAQAIFRGVGRQPYRLKIEMQKFSGDPTPDKTVEVRVRGALVAVFRPQAPLNTYEADIPPELVSRTTGDVAIVISTQIFKPAGERRELGIVISSLKLEPSGAPGLLLPPFLHVLYTVASGLIVALLGWILGYGWRNIFIFGLVTLLGITLSYILARQAFGLFAGGLVVALALTLILTLVAQLAIGWLYRRTGLPDFEVRRGDGRGLFTLFAGALGIGFAGLIFVRSNPNDFGFHLNRFRRVLQGDVFFDDYYISGVGQTFYPPAYYVLLYPFGKLLDDVYWLIRLFPVFMGASLLFVIFYAARRNFPALPNAGLYATALYVATPIYGLLLWWQHQTNHFGLVILTLTVVYLWQNYEKLVQVPYFLGALLLIFLVLLSHPATVLLGGALLGGLVVISGGLRWRTGRGNYKAVGALALALTIAGGVAYALYYSRYFGFLNPAAAPRQTELQETTFSVGGSLNLARLTFEIGVLGDYALVPLLLAPVGLWLMFRRKTRIADEKSLLSGHFSRITITLVAWLALSGAATLVTILTGQSLRPLLFAFPPLVWLGGLALAFFDNSKNRRIVAGLLLGFLALISLYWWIWANLLGNQPPHIF